jgi:hypothetical protein
VPYDRGDLVSAIHEQGMILSQEHEEGGAAVHARVGEHLGAPRAVRGLRLSSRSRAVQIRFRR